MIQVEKSYEDYQGKIDEIQCKMEALLPASRFAHTIGVAHLAACLAMCYDENPQKAMLAGLLHDNAKYIEFELAILECERNNLLVTECERNNPVLLHGKLGAFYARTRFGIEEEDILSAIRYHTTGKPAMSFLEKTIFLADYIEPRRTQPTKPELSLIRTTAFHNLDLSVYYAIDNTLSYLYRRRHSIDVLSEQALAYYKKIVRVE